MLTKPRAKKIVLDEGAIGADYDKTRAMAKLTATVNPAPRCLLAADWGDSVVWAAFASPPAKVVELLLSRPIPTASHILNIVWAAPMLIRVSLSKSNLSRTVLGKSKPQQRVNGMPSSNGIRARRASHTGYFFERTASSNQTWRISLHQRDHLAALAGDISDVAPVLCGANSDTFE